MPSPFPGFDPYLEAQGFWEEFHAKFINYLQEAIADRLPNGYEARIEERLSLVQIPDPRDWYHVRPDVAVLKQGAIPLARRDRGAGPAAVATADPVRVRLAMQYVEEVREHRVEVRRRPGRTLVTVVEVLSPSNKEAPGRRQYVEKRLDLLRQPVHLVEIDLLAGGTRLPMDDSTPPGDYLAYVSRSEDRPDSEVFAWSVRQPLPAIPIPLAPPDPDVPLDLGPVFSTTFERGRYLQAIDYTAPLPTALSPEDRTWAEATARGDIAS